MALMACQPSPFGLTAELEGTCAATALETPTNQALGDQVMEMGTVPSGSQARCFEVTWPIDLSTYIRGFKVVSEPTDLLSRSEVYRIKTDESLAALFGVEASEAKEGFECPGVLGDDRLSWWFESQGNEWVVPEAGVRQASGGTRLLIRTVFKEELATDTQLSSQWLTTDTPDQIALTTSVYDPFWLVKGAFDLPAGEPSIERAFIFDLATRLALDSITIKQVRFEVGGAAKLANLSIERASGERVCVDHRTSLEPGTLTNAPLVSPLVLEAGDFVQLTCQWDTTNKQSASLWSMTDELCRAVIIYTTEENL